MGRRSDYDLAVVSERLIQQAEQIGIPILARGGRTVALKPEQATALGLNNVVDALSLSQGREVTIMIYRTEADLVARGPHLRLP